MKTEKKIFLGGMNSDDAEYLLAKEDYRDALNMRNTSSRSDEVGSMENMKSVAVQDGTASSSSNYCIGSCEDKQNRLVYSFVCKPSNAGHYIREFDGSYGTIIIQDTILNFDRFHLIDAEVVGDFLYWTDGYNPPRYLNIKRFKAGEYPTDLKDDDLNLIMKAPNYPLTTMRLEDSSYGQNYISLYAFQFAYRYVFKDGQQSVLSPYSLYSVPTPNSAYNYIRLNFEISEAVPSLIEDIEIYFKTDKSDTWTLFKRDSIDTVLSSEVKFYNDTLGQALASSEVAKYFESIPLKSDALTVAQSRLFLGGNTEVYDDTNVAITFTVQDVSSASTTTANIVYFTTSQVESWGPFSYTGSVKYDYYYIYNSLYYFIEVTNAVVTDFTAMTAITYTPGVGYTETQVKNGLAVQGWHPYSDPYTSTPSTAVANQTVNVGVGNIYRGYSKSRSHYKYGIVFKDDYNRSSGVITDASQLLYIPDQSTTIKEVAWSINTSSSSIPEWATSYQIVRTKNLRCTSFLQYKSNDVFYFRGEGMVGHSTVPDQAYNFGTAYDTTSQSIYIAVNALGKIDVGYTYQQGDLLDIYIGTTWHTLEVTGQDSFYIVCKLKNLGTLTSPTESLFEIYSPVKQLEIEEFFEVGNAYPISSPGASATFSNTSGIVDGDVYIITNRAWYDYVSTYSVQWTSHDGKIYSYYTDFLLDTSQTLISVETMNPYETKWEQWLDNTGKVNIVVEDIEEKHKTQSIRFSNVFTPGTLNNGIHSFELLNEDTVPMESGSIQKLVFTSGSVESTNGTQSVSNVMLAICRNAANSIYIGESQIVDNYGDSILAISNNVIGTIRPLKGDYGTQNPESVKVLDGAVFWWDLRNAAVVRYSSNGLFPISNQKMRAYFRDKADRIKALNLQGFYAFGGVDKRNSEYVLSFANYSDTVIDGYTNVWSDPVCVLVNSNMTGDYRMKTLNFNKYEDGILMSGYPTSYPITDAFTHSGTFYPGTYSALTDTEFASLSVVDYTSRLLSFLNYIITVEQGEYTINNEYEGTDIQMCPA